MELNTSYYPLIGSNENVEITKTISELTDYETYLEKSIMYACCNNKYLSYYNPSFVTRTSDSNYMHHTINTCETNKNEFVLGYNRYTGGLYSYFGGELSHGFHGADITLIRKFQFDKTYINLDNYNVTYLNLDHANMVGSGYSLDGDRVTTKLTNYIAQGLNFPIIGWNNFEMPGGVSGENIFPMFCRKYDYSFVYTPTSFSYRSDINSYLSAGASWGNVSDIKFYGNQTGWDNAANTTCGFYLNNNGGTLSCGHVLGIPDSIEDFATPKNDGHGNNPSNGNYFIPDGYDYSDSPLPVIMYDGDWQSRYFHAYSADYLLHMIASLGLRFKLNNLMYASEIDKNGFTTGRFVPVSELPSSNFANKDWISSENSSYDRDYIPDKPIVNDLENIGLNENTGNSRFVKWYIMTPSEMLNFQDWLNSDERPPGFDSMKNIISVSEYMFDLNLVSQSIGVSEIKVGTEHYGAPFGDVVGKLLANVSRTYHIGSVTIQRYNNDFTDYSPYSTYNLYIPYVGWLSLDSDIIVGNTVDCYIIADPISGGCKGIAMCQGNIIAEGNGTFGNSIPVSSNNIGQYKQALLNNALSISSGVIGAAAGAAAGNPVGVASGALSLISGISQSIALKHTSFTESKGTTTTATMYNTYDKCVLVETHPIEKVPTNYGHTVGYVTNKTKNVSDCRGFVIAENVDTTGLSCSYSEKQAIKNILETGFYC